MASIVNGIIVVVFLFFYFVLPPSVYVNVCDCLMPPVQLQAVVVHNDANFGRGCNEPTPPFFCDGIRLLFVFSNVRSRGRRL